MCVRAREGAGGVGERQQAKEKDRKCLCTSVTKMESNGRKERIGERLRVGENKERDSRKEYRKMEWTAEISQKDCRRACHLFQYDGLMNSGCHWRRIVPCPGLNRAHRQRRG